MSSSSRNSTGERLGLPTILFVVFLVLKLIGKIGWSWWWVTAPLWIGWCVSGVFIILALLFVALAGKATTTTRRRR